MKLQTWYPIKIPDVASIQFQMVQVSCSSNNGITYREFSLLPKPDGSFQNGVGYREKWQERKHNLEVAFVLLV